MNNTKKINVNFSSLVGLKTELLRKQHEVNEAKLKSQVNHVDLKMKKKPKKTKNENVNKNVDKSEYIEDVNTHKKSKLMLEAKARLYEQLKRSRTNNDNFLVDFKSKSDESEEETLQNDEENENDIWVGNEDDWVEYEDCFGRTRKCLREDLPFMQEKDKLIKQQIINEKGVDPKTKDNIEQNVVENEKEPEIEVMRRKWEEQTRKLADKVNIHYQDVLFDEARTHGVGYYAFSQSEEERLKQQENLSNLRKETERKQKEIKELKELREKMECNRLKAARIRQRIRAGLPIDTIEEEFKQKNDNESNQSKSEDVSLVHTVEEKLVEDKDDIEKQDNKEDTAVVKESKIQALGELLGKRSHWYEMSQEEWVYKCRKMRVNEFGPVYDNFKSGGYLNTESKDKKSETNQMHIQNDEINIDSYDIPLPPPLTTNYSTTEKHNSYDIPLPPPLAANDSTIEKDNSYDIPLPPTLITNDFATEKNNSYDIPLPPSLTINDFTSEKDNHNRLSIITDTTQYESNNVVQSQIKPATNIDEASIAAGLRYLREKFEKSQNS